MGTITNHVTNHVTNNTAGTQPAAAPDPELVEWMESFEALVEESGPERAARLLEQLRAHAERIGIPLRFSANTAYVNTIPYDKQPPFPGDQEIERRIKSIIRWNALAMVVRANRVEHNIGGHISTYASQRNKDSEGDHIYFQGHAAPGIYARAFLEGRLTVQQLENFRRELHPQGGLSSYPHPWLMPEFWQFPTVSMGLGPISAIYQARFNRYLEDRGLKPRSDSKVWAYLGDGETDEPEALGAITLAAREQLDNLIFVVNCNLQRLDGPVRGNGKIISELEAIFRGAGWNVIKVIWGSDWDSLLEHDAEGTLVKRMGEVVDGESQKYVVEPGSYTRQHFFGADPRLLKLVEHLSDDQVRKLRLGGHDPRKVYAAYKAAVEHHGSPTVVLARTIKGYGLGEAGEGRNITHQQKKLNEDELREFRSRFGIPIRDEDVANAPFYRPPENSPEMQYLRARREELGGFVPQRSVLAPPIKGDLAELFKEFEAGSEGREVSTTMAFVGMLRKMMRDPEIGKLVVPIVPDEARTFGMESLFRMVGIYAHGGQKYEPVDVHTLLYYKEAVDGQILEEGITEAGSVCSFTAAGTAYATHGINTIPFFIFYSMFGLQRVGDLVWAAADMSARGFLLGATSGRTTLAGEGLQHQDGNSHILAMPVPNLRAYDPAFAYEISTILEDGIRRMYHDGERIFYYITLMNEPYVMPSMPAGAREGILRGMYRMSPAAGKKSKLRAQLLGSGAILTEALRAQEVLAERFGVAADVWSVTSYKELYRDAMDADRENLMHPGAKPRVPHVASALAGAPGPIIAASDYLKALPLTVSKWMPRQPVVLGTDGFGRSDSRAALRHFFEVDAPSIAMAALLELHREGHVDKATIDRAFKELAIDPSKPNPVTV